MPRRCPSRPVPMEGSSRARWTFWAKRCAGRRTPKTVLPPGRDRFKMRSTYARADVALAATTAATGRLVQAVQSLLNMQV